MHQPDNNRVDPDPLDRLLLVHSEISSILGQIDELVVQVVSVKTINNKQCIEVKSFADALSEICSILKPWVPRLQKALAKCSTEPKIQLGEASFGAHSVDENDEVHTPELITRQDVLVSSSPLVSWRASDCTIERGKQLFLLTPLPRPKTMMPKPSLFSSSKPTACENISMSLNAIVSSLVAKNVESMKDLAFASPPTVSMGHVSHLETPCLKDPPRSRVLLEPDCEFMGRNIDKSLKSTPFPYPKGSRNLYESSDSENSAGNEVSENMGLKYLELIGIKPSCMFESRSKAVVPVDVSPAWVASPPKCCTVMEPSEEDKKPIKDAQELCGNFNRKACLTPKQSNIQLNDQVQENNKFPNQGNIGIVESTPLWKGCESTVRRGKRAGENTLKKELWERFAAVSTTSGFHSLLLESSNKGFLDMLEEASCDSLR